MPWATAAPASTNRCLRSHRWLPPVPLAPTPAPRFTNPTHVHATNAVTDGQKRAFGSVSHVHMCCRAGVDLHQLTTNSGVPKNMFTQYSDLFVL